MAELLTFANPGNLPMLVFLQAVTGLFILLIARVALRGEAGPAIRGILPADGVQDRSAVPGTRDSAGMVCAHRLYLNWF